MAFVKVSKYIPVSVKTLEKSNHCNHKVCFTIFISSNDISWWSEEVYVTITDPQWVHDRSVSYLPGDANASQKKPGLV